MLGIAFTEFTEMVEEKFSAELADRLLIATEANLESKGIYTAVGYYNHTEMLVLVSELSRITGIPVDTLVRTYGRHLFGRFHRRYPNFFLHITDTMSFLSEIESHIHREVRKLYPAAELPSFQCTRHSANEMTMIYRSSRPFAQLAFGLIEGCAAHFGEALEIEFEDLSDGGMTHAKFTIKQASHCDGKLEHA